MSNIGIGQKNLIQGFCESKVREPVSELNYLTYTQKVNFV